MAKKATITRAKAERVIQATLACGLPIQAIILTADKLEICVGGERNNDIVNTPSGVKPWPKELGGDAEK